MLQIIIENEYGQTLDLTAGRDYFVKLTGLTPGSATINHTKIATKPGTKFNNSSLNARNIVMTIRPLRNIERNRIELYKYIMLGKTIKIYLKNGTRDVWIEGKIETLDGDLYTATEQLQASIICPDPYFKSVNDLLYELSGVTPKFTFPFVITSDGVTISELATHVEKNVFNNSDEECGLVLELYASALALEPTIYNMTTGERFTINHEFQVGDIVRLNTRAGEKSLTLIRDGIETNILNSMDKSSDWFTLRVGDNVFAYSALHGAEFLQLNIKIQPIHTGV